MCGKSTVRFLMMGALLCAFGIALWVGCGTLQSPTAPSQTTLEKKNMNDADGIRCNGTESDETHPPVNTYEVWFGGTRLQGPSPLKNFWTKADAEWAYTQAINGAK